MLEVYRLSKHCAVGEVTLSRETVTTTVVKRVKTGRS